jgi:formate hydrogenlyase subunit 3/multisubunit Na+/H+ antiporter MnhD subunit
MTPAAESCILLLLFVPLGAAMLNLLLPRRGGIAMLFLAALAVPLSAAGLGASVLTHGPATYSLGGWSTPLGIRLYADGLSTLMLVLASVIGSAISFYAAAYFAGAADRKRTDMFRPVWLIGWTGLNGLFLSGDIFNLYVCLEILTLTSISLIAVAGTHASVRAALRYLPAAIAGSMFYLLGVAVLYGASGVLDIELLAERVVPTPPFLIAFALMVTGLLIKAALFPAHYWLPPAHANAPAPVSALLSGLVVTAAFYILLRVSMELFVQIKTPWWAGMLGLLGTLSILWGGLQALRQDRLKMVIAYSTVSQAGYGFLLFPLVLAGGMAAEYAWNGAVYFALAHAVAKAAAFLSVGALMHQMGHDRLHEMQGAAWRSPFILMAFALAALSLMGLPPSAGFVAKWMMLKSALLSGQWGYAVVIVGGGVLAMGYLFRVLEVAMREPPAGRPPMPVPTGLALPGMALALAAVLLGIFSDLPLRLLQMGPTTTLWGLP